MTEQNTPEQNKQGKMDQKTVDSQHQNPTDAQRSDAAAKNAAGEPNDKPTDAGQR